MAVFYAVVHSFLEEYYWRWFFFGQMRRLMPVGGRGRAVQPGLHGPPRHRVGGLFRLVVAGHRGLSLAVAVGGMVWAWIYHRSGSLLGPWLSHALADAAMFTVGHSLFRATLGW